jgi:3-hexulose-6-phosphate synthase/6-phospho-3-hexuloisomerase
MDSKPKLQIALDLINLEDALRIANQVVSFVDIIEAGTPLIKSEGIGAVKILKKNFPEQLICADLKTADAGYLEVKMAAEADADIISILADAYNNTIEEALRASYDYNVEIMADLIVSRKPIKRLKEIMQLHYKGRKLTYALAHSGLDRQSSRRTPLTEIEAMTQVPNHPKLAIAGGIRSIDIENIMQYPISIVIVGGAITQAENPSQVSQEIKQLIEKYTQI